MQTATLPSIKWDYSGLDKTAKVIYAINPNGHTSPESVESYIISLATKYAADCEANRKVPTITGTGGWYVTFIPASGDEFDPESGEFYDYNVEVTLMSYTVERYLKETGVL